MTTEIDYLLRIDESGVQLLEGAQAVVNNITEWLDTARGSIYGRPDWGNELAMFRHEPPSETTAIAIENSVIIGLARDIPSLLIAAIRCEPHETELDMYRITVSTSEGIVETTLNM